MVPPPSPPLVVLCQWRHLVASGKALACNVSLFMSLLLPPGVSGCPARPGQGCRGNTLEWWRGQGRQGQGCLGAVGAEGQLKDRRSRLQGTPTRCQSGGGWEHAMNASCGTFTRGAGYCHQATSPAVCSDHRLGSPPPTPRGFYGAGASGPVGRGVRVAATQDQVPAAPPRSGSRRLWDAGSHSEKLTS